MKTLYLTIKPEILTTVKFGKPQSFRKIKINKVVLSLNYFNISEKADVKTANSRVDFPPGFWTFKEIQKGFDKLGITLTISGTYLGRTQRLSNNAQRQLWQTPVIF